jgi:hypothetical protein
MSDKTAVTASSSINADLELIESLVEGYDHLGTGSDSRAASREAAAAVSAWKRVRAAAKPAAVVHAYAHTEQFGATFCTVCGEHETHPSHDEVRLAADALLSALWNTVVTGSRTQEENWSEMERRHPGAKRLHAALKIALPGASPTPPGIAKQPTANGDLIARNREMITRWKEIALDGPDGNEPLGAVVRRLEATTDALVAATEV